MNKDEKVPIYDNSDKSKHNYTLDDLIKFAKAYVFDSKILPISFNPDHYVRSPIYKDEHLEIVVLCFAPGQTSTVHDHQGSNCVVRIVEGEVLETIFNIKPDYREFMGNHLLNKDDVSGLDGITTHQISNISKSGAVLLNFYSPPFTT